MSDKADPSQKNIERAMVEALQSVERIESDRRGAGAARDFGAGESPGAGVVELPPEQLTADLEEIEMDIADMAAAPEDVLSEDDGLDPRDIQIEELKDHLLRLAADFENYRKRAQREQQVSKQFGAEPLARALLDVADNLERAVAHAGEESPLLEGVRMVRKQLLDALASHGVQAIAAVGEVFDPEFHEAVGQLPTAERAPGVVVEEALRGYMIHERLLRAAQVVVACAPNVASNLQGAGVDGDGPGEKQSAE